MFASDETQLRWWENSSQWYIDKGYKFTKNGDFFTVKISDLHDTSSAKVKLGCDNCGKENYVPFNGYKKSQTYKQFGFGGYYCYRCGIDFIKREYYHPGFTSEARKFNYQKNFLPSIRRRNLKFPDVDAIEINLRAEDYLEYIPERTGIYKFYSKEKQLLYIGKAENLKTRIKQHMSGSNTKLFRKFFHTLSFFFVDGGSVELADIEKLAINELKPKYNVSDVMTYDTEKYKLYALVTESQ